MTTFPQKNLTCSNRALLINVSNVGFFWLKKPKVEDALEDALEDAINDVDANFFCDFLDFPRFFREVVDFPLDRDLWSLERERGVVPFFLLLRGVRLRPRRDSELEIPFEDFELPPPFLG